jgi:DNA-binding transcriptional LysR family regulator
MVFTFEESELLSELEKNPTLMDLAEKLKKDSSVISRQLKRISEKAPVIEKINGRWMLTELGKSMALWAKKIAIEQNEILGRDYSLTIATTREFASRILAKNFENFLTSSTRYKIITCEDGIEASLLNGTADFGFDCGRPQDPDISFKQIIEEEIVTVASTKFLKKHKIKTLADLSEETFIHYTRLRPLLTKNINVKKSLVSSNDLAVLRTLLVQDLGWATLPFYAIQEEILDKTLQIIPGGDIKGFKFGVWWLRGRESLLPKVKEAQEWLQSQRLTLE